MPSIRDVAKRAGVGVGTVSRVLNGTGYVADATREKILDAVRELNYTPNELARNLYHNRSGIVALIIPSLDHPFFASFCSAAEMELYHHGYKTMVCNTAETSNREQEYLEMLERNIVDGIITGAHTLVDSAYQRITRPIVALDRDLGPGIPVVHSDHARGGRLAAEALIRSGCRSIIQFAGASIVRTPSHERHEAFSAAVQEHGIDLVTVENAWNNFTFDYFYETMGSYMCKYPQVDGIFTSDIAAVCCCNILQDLGRRVPQDVQIIGYDATYITRTARPVITAVRQDIDQLAACCVRTLLGRIAGDSAVPMRQVYGVDMQWGGSTR